MEECALRSIDCQLPHLHSHQGRSTSGQSRAEQPKESPEAPMPLSIEFAGIGCLFVPKEGAGHILYTTATRSLPIDSRDPMPTN